MVKTCGNGYNRHILKDGNNKTGNTCEKKLRVNIVQCSIIYTVYAVLLLNCFSIKWPTNVWLFDSYYYDEYDEYVGLDDYPELYPLDSYGEVTENCTFSTNMVRSLGTVPSRQIWWGHLELYPLDRYGEVTQSCALSTTVVRSTNVILIILNLPMQKKMHRMLKLITRDGAYVLTVPAIIMQTPSGCYNNPDFTIPE